MKEWVKIISIALLTLTLKDWVKIISIALLTLTVFFITFSLAYYGMDIGWSYLVGEEHTKRLVDMKVSDLYLLLVAYCVLTRLIK